MNKQLTPELIEKRRRKYEHTANDLLFCRTCAQEKLGSEFYFDKYRPTGRRTRRCKSCETQRLDKIPHTEDHNHRRGQKRNQRKQHSENAKTKHYATQSITYAIKAGIISKSDKCQKCGSDLNIECHHPNGWKTIETLFDIEWLCRFCHRQHHKEDFVRWGKTSQ